MSRMPRLRCLPGISKSRRLAQADRGYIGVRHEKKWPPTSSRLDPCSVDFGRETPKFRFEFCRGFFGGFFLLFFQGKRPEKIRKKKKKKRKIHRDFVRKNSPSDFCRSLSLTLHAKGVVLWERARFCLLHSSQKRLHTRNVSCRNYFPENYIQ